MAGKDDHHGTDVERVRARYAGQLFPPATRPKFSRLQSERSAELRRRIRRLMASENIHSDEAYLLVLEADHPLPGDEDYQRELRPDIQPRDTTGDPARIPPREEMLARVAAIRAKQASDAVPRDALGRFSAAEEPSEDELDGAEDEPDNE